MNDEEIMQMAVSIYGESNWSEASEARLYAFAKLIAAKQRERMCAELTKVNHFDAASIIRSQK